MRSVIKAFLIVGIVGGSIYALIGLCTLLYGGFLLLLSATPAIIICSLALTKLDTYGTGLAVVTLIFGSLVSGILMLVYKSTRDAEKKKTDETNVSVQQTTEVYAELEKNYINVLSPEKQQQLKELDKLYVSTVMNKDEYEEKKRMIMFNND